MSKFIFIKCRSPSMASSPSANLGSFLQELSRIPSYAHNIQTHITDYVQLHKILQHSHTPTYESSAHNTSGLIIVGKISQTYWDHQLIFFSKYGFPLEISPTTTFQPCPLIVNHTSALCYPAYAHVMTISTLYKP